MAKRKHRYAGPNAPRDLSPTERAQRILTTGNITITDLKKYYEMGRQDGLAWGYDSVLAPMLIALHREFGFGAGRIGRLMEAVSTAQIEFSTNDETYQQVAAETGVSIESMREYLDRAGL